MHLQPEIEEFVEEIEYLLDAITNSLATEVAKLRGVERLDVRELP
jgi:hypothetical protein